MANYITDGNNDNLSIVHGYEFKTSLFLNGLSDGDITGDDVSFDIGVEGETADYSGTATIVTGTAPQKIEITVPAGAFTEPKIKQVLQIRWTPSGENERVVFKGFLDVRAPVTPTP